MIDGLVLEGLVINNIIKWCIRVVDGRVLGTHDTIEYHHRPIFVIPLLTRVDTLRGIGRGEGVCDGCVADVCEGWG